MALRSGNSSPVTVPNTSTSLRLVSVVYDGLAVKGVLLVCRCLFRSLIGSGSTGFRYGVAVVRAPSVKGAILVQLSPTAIGELVELPWCQVVDLVPGDVIELNAGSATVDNWALDSLGFTVDFR